MIKVSIDDPEPSGVKVSRKNIALITITSDYTIEDVNEENQLLLFFMNQ